LFTTLLLWHMKVLETKVFKTVKRSSKHEVFKPWKSVQIMKKCSKHEKVSQLWKNVQSLKILSDLENNVKSYMNVFTMWRHCAKLKVSPSLTKKVYAISMKKTLRTLWTGVCNSLWYEGPYWRNVRFPRASACTVMLKMMKKKKDFYVS
jgi:hypothetical protein